MDRVHRGMLVAYWFCLAWGIACFVVLGLFGEAFVSLINDAPALVDAAGWFLLIVPVSFGLMGVGQVASSLFIALGKPMPPTLLSILRTLVVYVPLAVLFDAFWGFQGIFVALLVSNVLFGVAAWAWGRMMLNREVSVRVAPA